MFRSGGSAILRRFQQAEFMISEVTQKVFPEDGGFAARSDMPAPKGAPDLATLKIIPVDFGHIEKETGRIKRRFNEIFQ